jgi:hypothetical protein
LGKIYLSNCEVRIIEKLINHFGPDELGRGILDRRELANNDRKGREWRYGQMGVLLYINEGITLSFFKAAPSDESNEEIQAKTSSAT